MKFNFDNYRTQTVNSFNRLVDELDVKKPDMHEVKQCINNLRGHIVLLTCIEDKKEGIEVLDINIKILK